ncbi:MAG: hypothetical protein E6R03_11380 [Hyphomicrobiaceae bacterium]|nr:MAG: hypothetical protein E6R03_11380 [Hyphomicrobiaceae bacterium]
MAKKNCPQKKKPAPKGLAAAAASGGEPLEVSVKRMSMQLPLRDLFAAFALAGIKSCGYCGDPDETADEAFVLADAMMKGRLCK